MHPCEQDKNVRCRSDCYQPGESEDVRTLCLLGLFELIAAVLQDKRHEKLREAREDVPAAVVGAFVEHG